MNFDSVFNYHKIKDDYILKLINFKKERIPFIKLESMLGIITYNYIVNLSSSIYKSSVNSGKLGK